MNQKIYEWPFCPIAKTIHSWGNHFGKRTEWSLIYFLIYAYLNILAQSQILVISLYFSGFVSSFYWRSFGMTILFRDLLTFSVNGQNSRDFKQKGKESNIGFCMLWAKTPEPMSGSSMILCKCAHLLMSMSKNQSSFVHTYLVEKNSLKC